MRENWIWIPLLTVLFSCTTNSRTLTASNGELHLFNGVHFILEDKERLAEKDISSSQQFEELKLKDSVQIALFKNIVHDDYKFFIGLPSNTHFKQLGTQNLPENVKILTHQSKTQEYDYRLSQIGTDSTYVIELMYRYEMINKGQKVNSLFYILALCPSLSTAKSTLSAEQLINRFRKPE